MGKGKMALTQKYFSIMEFRQMFQLAVDSIKFTELAHSTIKNGFSKIILPRLENLGFNLPLLCPFLYFRSLPQFPQITCLFRKTLLIPPPLHLKKKCLLIHRTYTIKHWLKLNNPLAHMSESESSLCFLRLRFIVQ